MSSSSATESAPTTKTSASTSSDSNNNDSNTTSNDRNRNGGSRYHNWRPFRSANADNLCNFKGAIESLAVLGTKVEKTSQDFSKFTKAIHNYVLANFTYPKDISVAITEFEDPLRAIVADFPSKAKLIKENFLTLMDEDAGSDDDKDKGKMHNDALNEDLIYLRKAAFTEFNKHKTAASSNMAALWGFIMGKSSGSLQQQIKAPEEEYAEHMYNPVWLLQTIKKVISRVTQQSNVYHLTFHALKDLYNLRQKSDETVEEDFCHFKALTDLVQLSNGTQVFDVQGLYALEIGDDPNVTKSDVEQRFLAMMFIENSCTVRYSALWKELANSTVMKTDKYPKTMSEATYLLTHWKAPNAHTTNNRNLNRHGNSQTQLSFLQRDLTPLICPEIDANKSDDGIVKGTNGNTHAHITCTNCNWPGHYAPKCPVPRQQLCTYHYDFTQPSPFDFNFNQHKQTQ